MQPFSYGLCWIDSLERGLGARHYRNVPHVPCRMVWVERCFKAGCRNASSELDSNLDKVDEFRVCKRCMMQGRAVHKVARAAVQRFKHYADVSTKVDVGSKRLCYSSRNSFRQNIASRVCRHGDDGKGDDGNNDDANNGKKAMKARTTTPITAKAMKAMKAITKAITKAMKAITKAGSLSSFIVSLRRAEHGNLTRNLPQKKTQI